MVLEHHIFAPESVEPHVTKISLLLKKVHNQNILGGNNMFMSKKEKLAKYNALAKEYRETVKKAAEIEATKGEKFSWSYKMKAEQLLDEMAKIKF